MRVKRASGSGAASRDESQRSVARVKKISRKRQISLVSKLLAGCLALASTIYTCQSATAALQSQQPAVQLTSAPLELDAAAAAASPAIRSGGGGATRPTRQTTAGDDAFGESPAALAQPYDYHASMPVITKRELAAAIKRASEIVERRLASGGGSEASEGSELDGEEAAPASSALEPGSPGWLASSLFHKAAPSGDAALANQTRQALVSEEATRLLARQFKLTGEQVARGLPLISLDQTTLGRQCARPGRSFNCVPGRYRSLSGHCNNVQQADWGAAQTALVRYAPARYADHIARPPRASTQPLATSGAATTAQQQQQPLLPSARQVSLAVHQAAAGERQAAHAHMTTMLSFFGQFVFHDLALVPQFSASIKCCNAGSAQQQQQQRQRQHAECMPIELQPDGAKPSPGFCLDYVRSTLATRPGCNLGARDQLNLVSSFLDGSVIYGSSEAQARQLRAFAGGRLRSQVAPAAAPLASGAPAVGRQLELLPQLDAEAAATASDNQAAAAAANLSATFAGGDARWLAAARECQQMASMRRRQQQQQQQQQPSAAALQPTCFQAGDIRVNENIGLTLMHTIWLREHNLIAGELATINRHWRDERLFEEARRIVAAQLQHIAFNELLPALLGAEVMARFNLTIQSQGYAQSYDPQLNAGVSNELATAVFPLILATIPAALERYSDRLEMLGSTRLQDTFMDGSELFKSHKFGQYLTGMMSQSAMEPALALVPMTMDMGAGAQVPTARSLVSSSQKLNSSSSTTAAPMIDAVALAIQQGRDHGLRPYLYWRRVCQLRPEVRSWTQLELVMPPNAVKQLRAVYSSIEQLDLYLALLEHPAPGATVGPTFVCLLARQFYQLKHGDRFWFENDLPSVAFAPGQLEQLRQTSLAKVICRNSQASISFIQPAPMLASDPFLNAYQYCTNKAMEGLDLSKWRQPINSAQQVADELLMGELDAAASAAAAAPAADFGNGRALARGKRLISEHAKLIAVSLEGARGRLDQVARRDAAALKRHARTRARRHAAGSGNYRAGYRHLRRLKRQALGINNQSVIFELATNEVVRSLLGRGKDRERAQSVEADIRDFLYSLETIQLDNLLDNSAASDAIGQFIANSNSALLTDEQRRRLLTSGGAQNSIESASSASSGGEQTDLEALAPTRSSSVSMDCQDDERAFPCDHTTPFRTITGWCNNLQNPKFGQSFTLHDRLLPNAYEDGLSKPRQFSVQLAGGGGGQANASGAPERLRLPSARRISTLVHDDRSQLHARYSLALMQFGQFGLDHDLTRTPFSVALDGSLLDCSACDSKRTLHRDCLPIEIPPDDSFYHSKLAREAASAATSETGDGGRKCLHFVRSLNGQPALGPRQQLNALTAYLDGSEIYGSDNCEARSLRAFQGGLLNSSSLPLTPGELQALGYKPREILPTTRLNPECATPSGLCFHAGDQRASEQPGLTAMHTIFLRFHNSLARQLAELNRHWSDERLYQQARRIVGAVLQRIAYNEFAPRLLGLDYMSKFDLLLRQTGYAPPGHYDDQCSASILTEFAAAAFRMGHSLIRPAFPLLDRHYAPLGKPLQLRSAFFNSHRLLAEPQLLDSILRGIVSAPIETLDNSVSEELTNHLFERPRAPFSGMDLVALNIQRARDHGVPGYNRYRVKCNLTRARTFDELRNEVPQKLIKRLSSVYAHVDDIDLFTGGMSELPVHGGIIGPTLGCIIGLQLARLKRCDRFWHETSDPFVRFSAPQLAELRKVTLAKVLCSQADQLDTIQRHAMDVPDSYLNPRVPCASLPTLDLNVWRENQKACLVQVAPGGAKVRVELGHSKRVTPCRSCTCTSEGPVCRTAKINCLKTMQRAQAGQLKQLLADRACLVQCAWALDMAATAAA